MEMTSNLNLNSAFALDSIRDSRGVSLYKNISLAMVFMSSPSLLVDKVVFVTLHNLSLGNGLIFLNLLWLTGVAMKTTSLNRLQKTIFTYFLLIIFYFLAIWIVQYGFNLTGAGPRGMIRVFFHGLCFLTILGDSRFDLQRFSRFMVQLAFILAILSIILYYGCQFGMVSLKAVHPPGHGSAQVYMEGFGGYLNTFNYGSRFGFQHRSQSYFSEPTNFAQFLMVPLFLAGEKFRTQKTGKNFLIVGMISWAFFLTYSVANFFGVFVALLVYFMFRKTESQAFSRKARLVVFNIIMLVITSYGLYVFYEGTNAKRASSVIAKGTVEDILDRVERVETAASVLKYSMFGDLSFRDEFNDNPGLLGNTIIDGGVVVCGLLIILLTQLYLAILRTSKGSHHVLVYAGSVAYFVAFFWDGQLHENYFLFFIALFAAYVRADRSNRRII